MRRRGKIDFDGVRYLGNVAQELPGGVVFSTPFQVQDFGPLIHIN